MQCKYLDSLFACACKFSPHLLQYAQAAVLTDPPSDDGEETEGKTQLLCKLTLDPQHTGLSFHHL